MKRGNNLTKSQSVRRGISLPADLLQTGLARSRTEQRTFSSYLAHLIARDAAGELATAPAPNGSPEVKAA